MHRITFFTIVGALIMAGCSSQSSTDQANITETTPKATSSGQPSGSQIAADGLGSKQSGEHFAVTLTTEPAKPQVGDTKFVAKVLHHGEPFGDASVKVETSMPGMGMGGPSFELKNTVGDTYEGSATLPMGGDYEAKVAIVMKSNPDHTDSFTYKFSVSQ